MPRTYSNKTLATLADFMDRYCTNAELDNLFLFASVPNAFQTGTGKLARSTRAISYLSSTDSISGESLYADQLDDLFSEVVRRKQGLFDPLMSPREYIENAEALRRALKADGYDIVEGKIVSSDELELELASETSILKQKLQIHGMPDVVNTLDQAHQNFIEGRLEACNAMLRTSLESTLKHIAIKLAGGIEKIPVNNSAHGVTPADVRKYLRQTGFFEEDEIEFIRTFYGYASSDGSHPGMSNQSESRLRRLMIVALIQYCLEKLESKQL